MKPLHRLGAVACATFLAAAGIALEAAAQKAEAVRPEVGKPLQDRKSTRLNSSHIQKSRMPSSA